MTTINMYSLSPSTDEHRRELLADAGHRRLVRAARERRARKSSTTPTSGEC